MKTFKGLFIDQGIIKAGEFPVEPEPKASIYADELTLRRYEQALTSAKANAVKCEYQTLVATLMNGVKEGDVFVLPSGWDYRVEERKIGGRSVKDKNGIAYDYETYTEQVAKLYRTDGQIKLDRLGNTSSPVIQTEESQEEIFDDLFSQYFKMLHEGNSMSRTGEVLREKFTITRKP